MPILREAFHGHSRFDEFQIELGIATNTLTRRLAAMVDAGPLEKRLYGEKPLRHEYLLTARGRDLRPVLLALMCWGNKNEMRRRKPVRLVDTSTGEPVELAMSDARTGEPIGLEHRFLRQRSRSSRIESFAFDGLFPNQE